MDLSNPIDVLARTIWGESRGESELGMQAVASVVLNRVKHQIWWGHDIISVCLKPWQFSCWNKNDPNLPKLEAVTDDDPQFEQALNIATNAINGLLFDPTDGCDSYFDCRMPVPPSWAVNLTPKATIGHHVFYQTV